MLDYWIMALILRQFFRHDRGHFLHLDQRDDVLALTTNDWHVSADAALKGQADSLHLENLVQDYLDLSELPSGLGGLFCRYDQGSEELHGAISNRRPECIRIAGAVLEEDPNAKEQMKQWLRFLLHQNYFCIGVNWVLEKSLMEWNLGSAIMLSDKSSIDQNGVFSIIALRKRAYMETAYALYRLTMLEKKKLLAAKWHIHELEHFADQQAQALMALQSGPTNADTKT